LQPPAADGQWLVAVIPDRNVLDPELLVVGMHKGSDDAGGRSATLITRCRRPVITIGVRSGVATVIGVPALGLEREKDR
jgi:hypothetical protein